MEHILVETPKEFVLINTNSNVKLKRWDIKPYECSNDCRGKIDAMYLIKEYV